jgi:hypothetical protein
MVLPSWIHVPRIVAKIGKQEKSDSWDNLGTLPLNAGNRVLFCPSRVGRPSTIRY